MESASVRRPRRASTEATRTKISASLKEEKGRIVEEAPPAARPTKKAKTIEEDPDEPAAAVLLRLEPAVSRLAGLAKLDLRSQGMTALPAALPLCAALEHLDVGGNPLCTLDGIDRLPRLRILFATGCKLGGENALPAGGPLSRAASLFMLSLKENGLKLLDGAALPPGLGWLIAAQNEIAEVRAPARLAGVRKLMLSHNRLDSAAAGELLTAIPSLEMLRIACNRLETVPEAALAHPRLAWLALGGNPYAKRHVDAALAAAGDGDGDGGAAVAVLPDASHVEVGDDELGRGSGAVVRRGAWRGTAVACKLWSAELFSDGDARGEWQMGRLTGGCAQLVRTLAAWEAPALGMAVELLDGAAAVGGPPSFASVTRDALVEGKHPRLRAAQALRVAAVVARACAWLHARGLMHGDVYLHNTLRVPPAADAADDGAAAAEEELVRLSDLGAACAYDRGAHKALEQLEARSFGFLCLDLLSWLAPGAEAEQGGAPARRLRDAAAACEGEAPAQLPTFAELAAMLA